MRRIDNLFSQEGVWGVREEEEEKEEKKGRSRGLRLLSGRVGNNARCRGGHSGGSRRLVICGSGGGAGRGGGRVWRGGGHELPRRSEMRGIDARTGKSFDFFHEFFFLSRCVISGALM